MKDEELTIWDEDINEPEGEADQELTLWEEEAGEPEGEADQELTLWEEEAGEPEGETGRLPELWEEERVFGQDGDEDISLWADYKDLPPVSELLLHEADTLSIMLPEGFKDWPEVARYYRKFYYGYEDLSICYDKPLTKSLNGAVLYGSADEEKQRKGSEYIKEAADREDAVGMRLRAVVLLEGLVCDRDCESALKWLHLAARAGDLKALRILVYALFGMEKILVAPREDAKREDNEGRCVKITDLFDGVSLSDKEKLYYVKALIELTKDFYEIPWEGYLWNQSIYRNRPLLTLIFGYLKRMYEIDKDILDVNEFTGSWGTALYEMIKRKPLYDGILIPAKESAREQIADLCRILNTDEDALDKPTLWVFDPYEELSNVKGRYTGAELKFCHEARNYEKHLEEIDKWDWNRLRMIVSEGPNTFYSVFYVHCMKVMADSYLRQNIDFSDKKIMKKTIDVAYIFEKMQNLSDQLYGYGGFQDSSDYKYLAEQEKKFLGLIDGSQDPIRVYREIVSRTTYNKALLRLVKEYSREYNKYYSEEEFKILKEEAAGNVWPKEASYLLGLRYEYGQGTEADWSEAVKCFKRAEGGLYKNNSKKHLQRLEPQAQSFREMKNLLPLLHSPQASAAAERIKELSGKGFSPAKLVMARQMLEPDQYKRADFFFPYDPQQGLGLLKEAAELGNLTARYELLLMGRNGKYNYEPNEALADKYQQMQQQTMSEDLYIQ